MVSQDGDGDGEPCSLLVLPRHLTEEILLRCGRHAFVAASACLRLRQSLGAALSSRTGAARFLLLTFGDDALPGMYLSGDLLRALLRLGCGAARRDDEGAAALALLRQLTARLGGVRSRSFPPPVCFAMLFSSAAAAGHGSVLHHLAALLAPPQRLAISATAGTGVTVTAAAAADGPTAACAGGKVSPRHWVHPNELGGMLLAIAAREGDARLVVHLLLAGAAAAAHRAAGDAGEGTAGGGGPAGGGAAGGDPRGSWPLLDLSMAGSLALRGGHKAVADCLLAPPPPDRDLAFSRRPSLWAFWALETATAGDELVLAEALGGAGLPSAGALLLATRHGGFGARAGAVAEALGRGALRHGGLEAAILAAAAAAISHGVRHERLRDLLELSEAVGHRFAAQAVCPASFLVPGFGCHADPRVGNLGGGVGELVGAGGAGVFAVLLDSLLQLADFTLLSTLHLIGSSAMTWAFRPKPRSAHDRRGLPQPPPSDSVAALLRFNIEVLTSLALSSLQAACLFWRLCGASIGVICGEVVAAALQLLLQPR
ncbi:hypothetical protein GPECTOR_290g777 [Gonium pectorale]|uniref:Uncharacterized protein n=1 Tax=Gonium pectorale TaxID=33097 RepID=A0A150FW02_GONPE|nr:hypothetical protein GPECTOR_290g777 [Gonium pectorale]|eukprot:KXZ41767.1 hypothetical protein GPECTOR_290g777 [Gonium pectorale]